MQCNAMQCNYLSIDRSSMCDVSDRCQAVPVSIDAHEAFRGATGVNAQILLHGCICEEPTLIFRGTLHDGAFRSRFWISIVEFCCAKKVFEWNSLEAHPTHPCACCFSGLRATRSHSDNVSEHVRVGTRVYRLMQLARPDEYPKIMLPSQVAGDYGLTNWFPSDEEGQKKMRLAELKNGRR